MHNQPRLELGICCHPKDVEGIEGDAFDFIEVNVQGFLVPELGESDFLPHLEEARRAGEAGRPVKAANCFLPGNLKCVGPEMDAVRLMRYAESAFSRAARAGIGTIVFGSGGARTAPEGYPAERAMTDFVGVLRMCGPIAQRHGVTVVVEPLNKSECNFINSLAQGAEAVEACAHPSVRLLADFYHMLKDGEPASEILRFGHLIRHTHAAELAGRAFPGKSRENFRPFFQALREVRYAGPVALECAWENLRADLEPSTRYLREQMV